MQSQQSSTNAGRAGSREADPASKAGAGETDKNLCKENSISGSLEVPKIERRNSRFEPSRSLNRGIHEFLITEVKDISTPEKPGTIGTGHGREETLPCVRKYGILISNAPCWGEPQAPVKAGRRYSPPTSRPVYTLVGP